MIATRWVPWDHGGVLQVKSPALLRGVGLELHLVHSGGDTVAYWFCRRSSVKYACVVGLA